MTLMDVPRPNADISVPLNNCYSDDVLPEQFIMIQANKTLKMINNNDQSITFNSNEWMHCTNPLGYIAGGIQLLSENFNKNMPTLIYYSNVDEDIIQTLNYAFVDNFIFVPFNRSATIHFFNKVLESTSENNDGVDDFIGEKVVIAATDASMGRSSKTATIAGISQDGKYFATPTVADNINQAELIAIIRAVRSFMRDHDKIRIYSDSQWAIDKIKSDNFNSIPPKYIRDIMTIRRLIDSNRLELCKVKGHSGHLMNDYADRLAVAQRRMRNVNASENKAIRNIITEFRENLKNIDID